MSTETLRPIHNAPSYALSGEHDWSVVNDGSDGSYLTYAIPDALTALYKLAPPSFFGTISAVVFYVRARHAADSGCTLKPALMTHGTTYYGSVVTLTSSFTTYSYSLSTNPYTGEPWTIQEIADLYAGFWADGTSQYTDIADVWAIPTYTASTATPIHSYIYPISNNTVSLTPSTGSNYACVDDPHDSPNDDTDYVKPNAASTWQTDLYNMGDLEGLGEILWVRIWNRVAKVTTGGTLRFKTATKTHSTLYERPAETLTDTAYTDFSTVYGYNPYTGAKWTVQEITDLLAGTQLYTTLADYLPKCTQVFGEVFSRPKAGGPRVILMGAW
jgi:hypothetical protein